ncbi:hypothetical protein CH251_12505 [Rhodococcus sp. 06-462-5]|nr:hypothetical protein CH251_12505 [Rhodococcus sp. 06-462-5]OZE67941.1 hypothetical protein CH270_09465 [Rhodococcus sp. 02-925g]OZF52038.1 hypothetical protein CH291_05515 [Rhodococcus sp. 14-1411-2a]
MAGDSSAMEQYLHWHELINELNQTLPLITEWERPSSRPLLTTDVGRAVDECDSPHSARNRAPSRYRH